MANGNRINKFLLVTLFSLLPVTLCTAQQKNVTAAAKKKEQVERSYKKAYARARKKTIIHRREIQSDATKEMMDAADKRADAYNKYNDPTFFERYFKRKKPPKK